VKKFTNNKGFTLMELLVVIAVIALLLSILAPSLQKAKSLARNVICNAHLKQWGYIWQMYLQDNNGTFHSGWKTLNPGEGVEERREGLWLHVLRPYYGKGDDFRTCPMARKLKEVAGYSVCAGGSRYAWGNRTDHVSDEGDPFNYGSYGLNAAVCSDENLTDSPYDDSYYWKSINKVSRLSEVPIMGDSGYWKVYPEITNMPPSEYDWLTYNPEAIHTNYMSAYCIDRHDFKVNFLFMDYSVRPIKLKDLWRTRWHREWPQGSDLSKYMEMMDRRWPDWME
jgi:prepilin-type N-terminal cleavage/methylation domain-containing protein